MTSLFAATTVEFPPSSRVPGLVGSDLMLVVLIGLGFLFVGGVLIWLIMRRRAQKAGPSRTPEVTITEDGRERHRKKRRSRRRDHRHRNPTLSQVGGLPPSRDAEESASL